MKIALLISGGVDSSVAAYLLVKHGYRPDLFYIKIGMNDRDTDLTCTMEEDLEMARSVAHKYGLKLEVVDLQQEYWDNVVKYTIDTVRMGFTPNPDVLCNTLIKFGAFYDKIGKNYDKIATGHYATTVGKDGKIWLGTGVDLVKDQTDFLCQLSYEQLSKAMFPIGNLSKSEVRRIAEEQHLVTAKRKDSQGICFLGKINYRDFLKKYIGEAEGDIVDIDTNKVVGKHQGSYLYTIGQRKGLGVGGGKPYFVCKKDTTNNIVYVTTKQDSISNDKKIKLNNIHWITENPFCSLSCGDSMDVYFKIRHSPEFTRGVLCRVNDGYVLYSEKYLGGIAAGQFCVIYGLYNHICYGSGEIQNI